MLTAEQREIQALAREFARGELRPHAARRDEERRLDRDVLGKLAELGFLGMRIPEEHGGLGLGWTTWLVVLEELAWGDAAVALQVGVHTGPVTELLLRHGNAEQRDRLLPRLATGELLGALALSEPQAGSDASAVPARARPADGAWVLSGEQPWVTGGESAGLVLLFARTGEALRSVGCFLVDPRAEGYRMGERAVTMGLCAAEALTVTLEGVRVGEDALLGGAHEGFSHAMEALDVGRLGTAAQALGVARSAFEHATGYALEREQFGRPIANFGAIQEKLAEMAARIEGARALTREVASLLDEEGEGSPRAAGASGLTARAAMAKLLATRTAMWVTDETVQVFGGYGYMRDYPVEKLMRDAKGMEIYEGTSEVLRWVIAREVLRTARGG